MEFDTTNPWVRWMLHVYNNRRFDGEIWLAVRQQGRMFLVEQNNCHGDVEVLGEVRTRLIDSEYVHDIVPHQKRSADELTNLSQQVERHQQHRQECYRRYSLSERVRDLG